MVTDSQAYIKSERGYRKLCSKWHIYQVWQVLQCGKCFTSSKYDERGSVNLWTFDRVSSLGCQPTCLPWSPHYPFLHAYIAMQWVCTFQCTYMVVGWLCWIRRGLVGTLWVISAFTFPLNDPKGKAGSESTHTNMGFLEDWPMNNIACAKLAAGKVEHVLGLQSHLWIMLGVGQYWNIAILQHF